MTKRALITGVTGQDGAYLSKLLVEKGYYVVGTYESGSPPELWRLAELRTRDRVELRELDLRNDRSCMKVLREVRPHEVYNLAAQDFISVSFQEPVFTGDITGLGVVRLLEAVRAFDPGIRFFQASSSEMFGKAVESPQTETTPFYPRSPYAIAKLYGHWTVVNYREVYDLFACSGILFNHESPLKAMEYVSRKIALSVAHIKNGSQDKILMGNINVHMDWGYAPEYVEAMWLMMNNSRADDYVIATGTTHTVREFVELAFRAVDINIVWEGRGEDEKGIDEASGIVRVEIDPRLFRPADTMASVGDASKALRELGWAPHTSLEELVGIMVKEDLKRVHTGSILT